MFVLRYYIRTHLGCNEPSERCSVLSVVEQRAERVGSLVAHQGHRQARQLDVGNLHPRRDLGELHHRRQQRPQQSRLRLCVFATCTRVTAAVETGVVSSDVAV